MDPEINEVETEELKAQCQRNWSKLKSIQAELQNLSNPLVSVSEEDGNRAVEILRQHEKRLKAEIAALEENEPSTFPDNKEIQQIILKQNQEKYLEQLEEVLVFFRAKRMEVSDELKQEEETLLQLEAINSALKDKLSSCTSEDLSEESVTTQTLVQDANLKLSKISTKDKFFRSQLKQILNQHFPATRQTTYESTLNESREIDASNFLPLSAIIGKLIEQSLNSPGKPYIDIDQTILPQHVEFLLRCHVALKDEQNSNRMKLVPFHL